jgi:hypothetical protein
MSLFRRLTGTTLASGLVAFYIVAMTGFNIWKPRILVIQSFSESSRSTMDLDAGMREKLRLNRLPVTVQWYYLNSDHPDLSAMKNSDIMNVKRVIEDFNPSLMILADDQANHLMALAPGLKRGRRIFFLGINQSPASFGYANNESVAGITNVAPYQSLLELLGAIHPGRDLRITVLGSDTDLGRHLGSSFEKQSFGTNQIVGTYYASTWEQWQTAVRRSNKNSDILLITAVHGLQDTTGNRIVSTGEVVKWTEAQATKVQPIGLIADYVPLGGSLSLIPSGFYRGSIAMESVLQWSEPSRKNAMPSISLDDHFDIGVRSEDLERRGIQLPLIYREAARLSRQLYSIESMGNQAEGQ